MISRRRCLTVDMNQYLSMFIDESNDHLQSLNENMLKLENDPDDISIVQVIFRSAHTLKGMSATMGYDDVAALTHEMENVLDLVRNEKLQMADIIFDTLFKGLDALQFMVQDITNGGDGKADVSAIVSSLERIVKGDLEPPEVVGESLEDQQDQDADAVAEQDQDHDQDAEQDQETQHEQEDQLDEVENQEEEEEKQDESEQLDQQDSDAVINTDSALDSSLADSPEDLAETYIDEYQFSVLEQSISEGHNALRVEVEIREDCQLRAARAYLIFDLLERYGEIVKSTPSVQDIEQEKFDRSFWLYYITQKEAAELKSMVLNLSEIERVEVDNLDLSSVKRLIKLPTESISEVATTTQEVTISASPIKSVQKAPEVRKAEQVQVNAPAPNKAVSNKAVPSKAVPAQTQTTQAKNVSAPSRTIRVDIERLDVLMNLFSELLIDRVRLEELSNEIKKTELTETVEHMSRVSGDLQNIVLKLRMVPIDTVFNRFPRMVRDLSKSLDKKIDLVIIGAETELDRTVVDEIGDPLVHLLRNAVDHGVEPISYRVAAGKEETGVVQLRAFHSGNHVFIEIEDDGWGINREKVLSKAIKNGVVKESEASLLSDSEVYQLLFSAGFSTADTISDISGRGVGLDVVKTKIESLGGIVTVDSVFGRGTKFSVQLPLTLSIISAMLIKVGNEKFAIPLSSIVETGLINRSHIRNVHGYSMVEYRETHIPLLSLSQMFNIPDYDEDAEKESEIVVIRKGERLAALSVEDFVGQSEIVIKNMGKYLPSIQGISGATILGDGQVALIIDPNAFIK